jgi:hypothetical protein
MRLKNKTFNYPLQIVRNKKAQGHIEVVVSFSIFMIFMLFLFIMFNPLEKPINPEVVEIVYTNLNDNLGDVLEKASIESSAFTCFDVNYYTDITGLSLCSSGMVVKDTSEPTIKNIFCAEDIVGNGISCASTTPAPYTVLYVSSEIAFSKQELDAFNTSYCNAYENLKDDYVLPTNDFAIFIYASDGETVIYEMVKSEGCSSPPPIPQTLNVFARRYPIQIFDESANVEQRIMQVMVW